MNKKLLIGLILAVFSSCINAHIYYVRFNDNKAVIRIETTGETTLSQALEDSDICVQVQIMYANGTNYTNYLSALSTCFINNNDPESLLYNQEEPPPLLNAAPNQVKTHCINTSMHDLFHETTGSSEPQWQQGSFHHGLTLGPCESSSQNGGTLCLAQNPETQISQITGATLKCLLGCGAEFTNSWSKCCRNRHHRRVHFQEYTALNALFVTGRPVTCLHEGCTKNFTTYRAFMTHWGRIHGNDLIPIPKNKSE